ncbi:MAG TPA: hypothetical protein VLD83_04080 [Candidatus Binatia bacterium]|jgi:hypothetical protein|nr:hypothetical protein [Candidatus Binatia bacterium]
MEDQLPPVEEDEAPAIDPVEVLQKRGSALPLILTLASVLGWFAFQAVQLFVERSQLIGLSASFETHAQEAQKMQTQIQALITKVTELANQGNPAAKAAVEELEKRGIPIRGAGAQPAK